MTYYYDQWGWLTAEVLPERSTELPPPATIPEGHAANFTGHVWITLPYVPPPPAPALNPVPQFVSRRQLRMALHRLGMLAGMDGYVAALSDPEVSIWWDDSVTFDRGNPVMNQHLPLVGLTSEQADAIFTLAGGL